MQSVFVTGAATGIGLAIAKEFSRAGWFVGLFDLNGNRCQELADTDDFPNAVGGVCDVTDRDSVAMALETFASKTNGTMHALVNNAGVLTAGPLTDMASENIDAMISVNIRGLTQVSQLAFPLLRDTPNSTVINLCSASSIHGIPLLAVYSASKFYVDGLTQALSIEWAEHDIHVTCLKPPAINTSMGHALDEKHKKKMPITMEPEAVAAAALAAVSSRRPHHILGFNPKAWFVLDRLLPARWGRGLTRFLIDM
ncbi:MAG: SDR family NAD(P)-dependent oxidoreductase [Pseudomonadota bacterium]